MRILLVTGLTHTRRGGVQRETERLIAGLLERGAHVGVLVDTLPATLHDAAAPGTLTHYSIAHPPPKGAALDRRLREVVAEHRPDALQVCWAGARLLWAVHRVAARPSADGRSAPLPWAMSIHNIPPRELIARWFQGRNVLHYAVRNAMRAPRTQVWHRFLRRGNFTRAVCRSDHVAGIARAAGCPPEKLVKIPLGCDGVASPTVEPAAADAVFDPDDAPRILSVGALAHHKGFHDYLRVVARLVAEHPRLRYVIIGDRRDPRYQRTLERLVARLGFERHVRVIANAPEPVRLAAAAAADLYVVPSHEEGFCLSYLEGAMLSPRLLGTRCGAMPEIAEGDPAQAMVAPRDLAGLERATRELLDRQIPPDTLQARRRSLQARFDWRRHLDAHLALYQELAEYAPAAAAPVAQVG